jgi:hypothetical protein
LDRRQEQGHRTLTALCGRSPRAAERRGGMVRPAAPTGGRCGRKRRCFKAFKAAGQWRMAGMGFVIVLGSLVAALLIVGVLTDWRARRRGRRIEIGTDLASDMRENRRDIRAWDRGSTGHSGEDISWMNQIRRRGRRR